jgi:catechol 2,3-dioxygenase-like lactoylglutathione lyase family enzyme
MTMPLIACVELGVADLARSRAFYGPLLLALGIETTHADDNFVLFGGRFRLYQTSEPTTGAEIGFTAKSQDAVVEFHRAGVAAEFHELEPPTMHAGRFSAAFEDPDANIVEAVHRTSRTN